MAISAYREADGGEMPLDLKLDLLVDAELPEDQRRALLERMHGDGAAGGPWRELALRFLQRQVEKETVRQLMSGGAIVPVEVPAPVNYRFPRRLRSPVVMSTAAGVLIAVTSALITLYVVQSTGTAASGQTATFHLPGQAVGQAEGISVNVPVVKSNSSDATAHFFPVNVNDGPAVSKRSVVIQGDGSGNAVVIPVNTMTMRIY